MEEARRHCLDVFQSWLLARFDDLTLEEVLIMLDELRIDHRRRSIRYTVAIRPTPSTNP